MVSPSVLASSGPDGRKIFGHPGLEDLSRSLWLAKPLYSNGEDSIGMRVAVTNQFRAVAGGAETYLRSLLPQLCLRGIEVGLWYDVESSGQREFIDLPEGSP